MEASEASRLDKTPAKTEQLRRCERNIGLIYIVGHSMMSL